MSIPLINKHKHVLPCIDMERNIMFAFFILFFLGLLWVGAYTGIRFLVASGAISKLVSRVLYGVSILMPIIMAGSMMVSNKSWSSLNSVIYTVSSSWIVIISGFFFSTVILWALYTILSKSGFQIPFSYAGYAVILCTVMFAGYGIINASNIKIKTVSLGAKTLGEELSGINIVLVSDLHIGLVRKKNFVEKVSRKIMEQNPDMVLIAGDLIDGPKFPYEEFLSPLKSVSAPLGVYFTPGNHEAYNEENELFYKGLPDNITVVTDDLVQIPGTSEYVSGFDYAIESDEVFSQRVNNVIGSKTPAIAILHDPKNRAVLGASGIPLTVSGHTHGGQFFPGTLMVKILYKEKISGLVKDALGSYYTTTGVGTAVSPARVGTDAEIVVLHTK